MRARLRPHATATLCLLALACGRVEFDPTSRDGGGSDATTDAVADALPADSPAGDSPAADSQVSDGPHPDAPCPWDCAWTARRKITFDNSERAETLEGFPVLVRLDATSIDYAQTRDRGEDLRFVDADGVTVLPHEIELWDETAISFVWVRVPAIDAHSTTDHVWMYFGNPTAEPVENPPAVWSGHRAVYHLGATATGAVGDVVDSTGIHHARSGDGEIARFPSRETGKIGFAQSFDGIDDYIRLLDSTEMNFDGAFTITAWVRLHAGRATWGGIVSLSGYFAGYRVIVDPSGRVKFQIRGELYALETGAALGDEVWHHVAAVYDGATMHVYVDGAPDPTTASRPLPIEPATTAFVIGRGDDMVGADVLYPLSGDIDEVRVAPGARSAAWIGADVENGAGSFVTITAE